MTVRGFWLVSWLRDTAPAEIATTYGRVARLVADGVLAAPVDAAYPHERYRKAVAHAGRSSREGKVLYAPGRDTG